MCLHLQKPLFARFGDLGFSLALDQGIHINFSQFVSSYKEHLITCCVSLITITDCLDVSVPSHSFLFILGLTLPQGTREGKHSSLLGCLHLSYFEEGKGNSLSGMLYLEPFLRKVRVFSISGLPLLILPKLKTAKHALGGGC